MQVGWIDFSEKDRKRAIDVIHLSQETGAVDELGIGMLRDALANLFFPGTSTVQTRAKYFIIIPYIIKHCCENTRNYNIQEVIQEINNLEKECAQRLKDQGEFDGVIGVDVIPDRWVVRKPYSIYWNGIRTLGLFTYKEWSLEEYIGYQLKNRGKMVRNNNWKSDGEEFEQDDLDAGNTGKVPFWNLPNHNKNWMDSLSINLNLAEASHLRKCILSLQDTLFKYILQHSIDMQDFLNNEDPFRALFEGIKNEVDDKLRKEMHLALRFDTLVFLCRVLYNRILSDDQNMRAQKDWKETYSIRLKDLEQLNLNEFYELFPFLNSNVISTITFLKKMQDSLLKGDLETAKKRIVDREIGLKGQSRSKLLHKDQYKNQEWIGGRHLDYRMKVTARLINDIYNAKEAAND